MQNIKLENIFAYRHWNSAAATGFWITESWMAAALGRKHNGQFLPENNAAAFCEQRAGVMAEFANHFVWAWDYFIKQGEQLQLRIKSFYGDDEKSCCRNKSLRQPVRSKTTAGVLPGITSKFDILYAVGCSINSLHTRFFRTPEPWETNTIWYFPVLAFWSDYKTILL